MIRPWPAIDVQEVELIAVERERPRGADGARVVVPAGPLPALVAEAGWAAGMRRCFAPLATSVTDDREPMAASERGRTERG